VVGEEDEIWHLGNVARRVSDVPALLAQLNGTKHLVRGNNDPVATAKAAGWASVQDYAELTVDGHLLVVCHCPFRSCNGQHRWALNLQGHSHGDGSKRGHSLTVLTTLENDRLILAIFSRAATAPGKSIFQIEPKAIS